METNSYKGWLNSDNFFKRVVSVYLYNLLGSCAIGCVFYAIVIAILIATGVMATIIDSASGINNPVRTMDNKSAEFPETNYYK